LLVGALIHSLFVALIDRLRNAEISRHLGLGQVAAKTAFFHAISDGHFQAHVDKIIRIVYYVHEHIYR